MRIAVLGAGSLGSLLGGLISRASDVELMIHGKGEHGAMMVANGLEVKGIEPFKIPANQALFTLEEVGVPASLGGTMDAVILTGKAQSTEQLASLALRLLAPDGVAVSLSNGLGHAETCAAILGPHRVVAGTTTYASWRPSLGVVQYAGAGTVILGHLQGGPTQGEVEPLLNALMRAGVQAEWTDNGPAAVWMKVLLNIAINPIAALSGVENGGLLAPNLFSSALETMLEGASIARAERVSLPDDIELEHHLQRVLESTAENQCSMLQDVRAGRTTEVAYLNQAVVERGERIGVRAPMNHMLSAMIEALTPDPNQR